MDMDTMNAEQKYLDDFCNESYMRKEIHFLKFYENILRRDKFKIMAADGYRNRNSLDLFIDERNAEHKCLLKFQRVLANNFYKSKIVRPDNHEPQCLLVELKPPFILTTLMRCFISDKSFQYNA